MALSPPAEPRGGRIRIVGVDQGKEGRDQGAVSVQEGPPPHEVGRAALLHHSRVLWSSQLSHEVGRRVAPRHLDASRAATSATGGNVGGTKKPLVARNIICVSSIHEPKAETLASR
jgi:hypothetical protein